MQGLRAERAEVASLAAESPTTGCWSRACTSATAGSKAARARPGVAGTRGARHHVGGRSYIVDKYRHSWVNFSHADGAVSILNFAQAQDKQ